MPEERDVPRLEQFNTSELIALSAIAVWLNQFPADRQDLMVRFIEGGKPLVAISGRRLPTAVM